MQESMLKYYVIAPNIQAHLLKIFFHQKHEKLFEILIEIPFYSPLHLENSFFKNHFVTSSCLFTFMSVMTLAN